MLSFLRRCFENCCVSGAFNAADYRQVASAVNLTPEIPGDLAARVAEVLPKRYGFAAFSVNRREIRTMLLNRDRSHLCIIDIQDRLAPAIDQAEMVIENSLRLITAATRLSIPVVCSEQYPKGLGRTVPAIAGQLPQDAVFEKLHFSCADDSGISDHVAAVGRPQLVLCGMEAHVCVLQSALGFKAKGYDVAVVRDAVSSRHPDSKQAAIDRLIANGIELATVEMVLFEWLNQAGTPEFKDLRGLIT